MRYLFITLLFISAFTFGQSSILYEVSGNGLKQNSYLFGTMHVQDEQVFNWNDSVFWALENSDVAAFELDFDMKEMQEFKNLFDTSNMQALLTYLMEDLVPTIMRDIPADTMGRYIVDYLFPFVKTTVNAQLEVGPKRSLVVDQYLQEYSRKLGKEILAIETFQEQISAIFGNNFDGLTAAFVSMFSLETMSTLSSYQSDQDKLVNAYGSLDYDAICHQISEVGDLSNPFATGFYDRIFTDRNQIMYDRTKALIKERSLFIAVGCGHLCGDNGLVQQYKNAGYTVRAIDLKGKQKNMDIQWHHFVSDEFELDLPEGIDQIELEEDILVDFFASNYTTSLFTSKGLAKFSIKSSTMMEEETFDWSQFMQEGGVEAAEEDASEVIDEAEEMAEEAIAYAEALDTDEEPAMEEQAIAYAEDSEMDDDMSHTPPAYNRFGGMFGSVNPMELVTEEMGTYFKVVSEIVKSETSGNPMMPDFSMSVMQETKDTFDVQIMGETYQAVRSYSITSNTIKVNVPYSDELGYELTIAGDPEVLRSKEVLRYFESFKFK